MEMRRRFSSVSRRLGLTSLAIFLAVAAGGMAAGEARRDDLSADDLGRVLAVTAPAADFSRAEPFEAMPGGATTGRKTQGRDVFSTPSANLDSAAGHDFILGNALFRKLWVASPSSTLASDGLGPLYNARSCQSCHIRDGRGHPPEDGNAVSMVLRLARDASTPAEKVAFAAHEALNFPDPVYGRQLQDFASPGLAAEGRVAVRYMEEAVALSERETVSLRRPVYAVEALGYGPLDPATTLSARVAPPMIGLGLIEAIHPADIEALADPQDRDGDGIFGRVARVRDEKGAPALGRFGWKAQNATVAQQTAAAFADDIGISTPLADRPYGDCTPAQTACLSRPNGVQKKLGPYEAPDPVLGLTSFYARHLAVPARRDVADPKVLAGKALFYAAGCAACHHPKFVTRRDAADPALAFQLIWPYSDFLLHDMGEGLADGQRVGEADGREWRTPPLWGIGLTRAVGGQAFFLHDGRARSLTEAILWHGGEGEMARTAFATLSRPDRDALLAFLESL